MRAEPMALTKEVEALLREAGLPTADLRFCPRLELLGVQESGQLFGLVGVELYKEVGLLRSLAVAETHRGQGYGSLLVWQAENLAGSNGIQRLYLLTVSAVEFFTRQGYQVTDRRQAPDAIRGTTEFSHVCPSSSILMSKVVVCAP